MLNTGIKPTDQDYKDQTSRSQHNTHHLASLNAA